MSNMKREATNGTIEQLNNESTDYCKKCFTSGVLRCDGSKCYCKDSFTGSLCNKCKSATDYIDGQNQCAKCPCSLENTFDATCYYNQQEGTAVCNRCKPGYGGYQCNKCAQNVVQNNNVTCLPNGSLDSSSSAASLNTIAVFVGSLSVVFLIALVLLLVVLRLRKTNRRKRRGLVAEDKLLLASNGHVTTSVIPNETLFSIDDDQDSAVEDDYAYDEDVCIAFENPTAVRMEHKQQRKHQQDTEEADSSEVHPVMKRDNSSFYFLGGGDERVDAV